MLVKTNFGKNITLTQNTDKDIMWLKLSCDMSDIHICCTYISPRSLYRYIGNSMTKLRILHNDITMYNCMGHIIVMSDINCRTGTDNDYIEQESSQCDVGVIPYTIDDAIVASDVSILKHRCPEEKIVNENCKELLNLCVGNNLCIVNGRIGEYPDGSFTCHTARGESVVDYFIVNTEQLRNVAKFKVQATSPLSDHNCITMDIKLTSPTITSTSHQRSMNTFYRWSFEIKDEYREQINSDNVQEQFAHVIANINTAECVSELTAAVKSINDIFLCCAVMLFLN